jgi:hypothetical protein
LDTQQRGAGKQKCRHGILRRARIHIDLSPDIHCDALIQSQRAMCVQSKALQCNWFPRREIVFAPRDLSERPFIECANHAQPPARRSVSSDAIASTMTAEP